MKISVEDGVVVCSLEDKNKAFMAKAWDCFDGFYNGKLKIHLYTYPSEGQTDRVKEEVRIIGKILNYAAVCGVAVDETVCGRLSGLRAILELDRASREEARREQAKRDKWLKLCVNGCGDCKHLEVRCDDHYCRASGDLLEERNKPAVIKGAHYMFNYEAFPSENCLYKI